MTNLVIEITVPISDNLLEQAETISAFRPTLNELFEMLPEGSSHSHRIVKERAQSSAPRGRKPKAAPNGAEGRQQPSA